MKIYFAGSIHGGRQDAELYQQLIRHLATHGEVLTEHLGSIDLTDMGEKGDAEEIFSRDLSWLKQADVVVAEVTTPSLGVGYELAKAEQLNKKLLCLYRDYIRKLTPMVSGNKYNTVKPYKTLEEARIIIDEFLNEWR